jgi:hypothetical protein
MRESKDGMHKSAFPNKAEDNEVTLEMKLKHDSTKRY